MVTFQELREADERSREELQAELDKTLETYEELKKTKKALKAIWTGLEKAGINFNSSDWEEVKVAAKKIIKEKGLGDIITEDNFSYYVSELDFRLYEELPSDMQYYYAEIEKLRYKLGKMKPSEPQENKFAGANIGNPIQPLIDFCDKWAENFKERLFSLYKEYKETRVDSWKWVDSQNIEDPRVRSVAGSLSCSIDDFDLNRIKEDGTYDWEGTHLGYIFKKSESDYYDGNKMVKFQMTPEIIKEAIKAVVPLKELKNRHNEVFEQLSPYFDKVKSKETDEEGFERIIQEMKDKMQTTLIDKTERYVGKILDARDLSVDSRLNLNGIVIGENGKCKVQTVDAGGYNIQCFHKRVLVNRIK